MKSGDLIKAVEAAGWRLDRISGSHHIFTKPGHYPLSIPHPKKDLGRGLVAKLKKAAGI